MAGYFITGTDTEIGKTHVSCLLVKAMVAQGLKVAAMKPVASGVQEINGKLVNDDAMKLMKFANVNLSYETVNPFLYKEAASPHIVAGKENRQIELLTVKHCFEQAKQESDIVLVEGVGGWLAPLSDTLYVEDMAMALQLPVILVVGIKLGCLNHALLTAKQIQRSGLPLAGWIANIVDPDLNFLDENISTLERVIDSPLLACIAYGDTTLPRKYEKSISLLTETK